MSLAANPAAALAERIIAPAGKSLPQRQLHLLRFRNGTIVERAAQRDDPGLLLQPGWRPRG